MWYYKEMCTFAKANETSYEDENEDENDDEDENEDEKKNKTFKTYKTLLKKDFRSIDRSYQCR